MSGMIPTRSSFPLAYGVADGAGGLLAGFGSSGIDSITRNSAGNYTVTYSRARFTLKPTIVASVSATAVTNQIRVDVAGASLTSCNVLTFDNAGVATDLPFSFMAFGN